MSKFPHDSGTSIEKRIKGVAERKGCNNAAAVLRNDENLEIPLYKDPDEIEEYEETSTEASTACATPKKVVKTVTKKKQSWYRLKDRIEEICSFLERIMDHQADTDSEDGVGFKIRLSPRKQLEGFQFLDIASNKAPLQARVVTLLPEGKCWVDFTRAIGAINLFGTGFGELLEPAPGTIMCSPWKTVPKAKDFLAVPTSVLKTVLEQYSNNDPGNTGPFELVGKLCWFVPDKLFGACQCTSGADANQKQSHSDRIQVIVPHGRLQKLLKLRGKPKDHSCTDILDDSGAVIFGKSRKLPLVWGDDGDPVEEEQSSSNASPDTQASGLPLPPVGTSTSTIPVSVVPVPNTQQPCITTVSRVRKASAALTDAFTKRTRY